MRVDIRRGLFYDQFDPLLTVSLPVNQIKAASILPESEYMLKYHGEKKTLSKNNIPRYFLVVDYQSKEGEPKRLDFWYTVAEASKVRKMWGELLKRISSGGNITL